MVAATAHDRLRGALRAELNRLYGRIGEIEQGLDRAEGYLGKYCRGEISIPVDVLLKCLELIEVEPGQFFCQALGDPPDSSAYLREIMAVEPEKPLARLQQAAAEAALAMPSFDPTDFSGAGMEIPALSEPESAALMVEEFMSSTAIEQRRRLRSTKRYRSAEFARAYLTRIVKLSYSEPKTAAKQAEVVGVDLVPKIEEIENEERLELILRSISVWVFASRLTDAVQQAALGCHFALALATAHRLDRLRAELLRMGAYVLSDNGNFQAALHLLGEAVLVWEDLGDPFEAAKVQVQRGGTLVEHGDLITARRVLHRALARLSKEADSSATLFRFAAYQRLSAVHERVGDLDQAETWLEEAIKILPAEQKINAAKISWQVARLNIKRGALAEAESRLKATLDVLIECQASECTLVALELTRVLLAQNKSHEAVPLARGMAHLISNSSNKLIDQGVLSEFVRAAFEGELSLAVVNRLESGIGSEPSRTLRRESGR